MERGGFDRKAWLLKPGRTRNYLLFISSTIVALCLLEIGLRLFAPPREIAAGTLKTPKAALYGWALPPNEEMTFVDPDTGEKSKYYTNSEGWKDVEHQFVKPQGVFRILFIGDSLTAGQVRPKDLFANKMRELLLERRVTNVEIISIGVGGWGTDQILEVLKLEGLKYEPDLVIYQFNPNDLTDNLSPTGLTPQNNIRWNKPFKYEIRNDTLVKVIVEPPEQSDLVSKVLMRSAIIYHLARIVGAFQNDPEHLGGEAEADTNWWENPIHPTVLIRYHLGEQTPKMNEAWELLTALILEMKDTVESNGARFIIFTTAGDEGQKRWWVDRGLMVSDLEGDSILWEGARYPVNWYRELEKIDQIAARYNIPLIKPVRAYERYKNLEHPNANGNLNMALDIVDYLFGINSIPGA